MKQAQFVSGLLGAEENGDASLWGGIGVICVQMGCQHKHRARGPLQAPGVREREKERERERECDQLVSSQSAKQITRGVGISDPATRVTDRGMSAMTQ